MVVLLGLNMMIMAPIMSIGGIIMALGKTPLSAILIVILPVMGLVIGALMRAPPLFRPCR